MSLVNWSNVSLRANVLLPQEIYISGWQLSPLAGLVCGGRLAAAASQLSQSKTLPDPIKPSVKRVKSGMKAFVLKMKYIADHENPKKPVVTL